MRKKALISVFTGVLIGIVSLTQTLSRPRMEQVRAVDVVSLLGAGACFGVAMVGLFAFFRKRRDL